MEFRNVCARYSCFGLPLTTAVTYLWSAAVAFVSTIWHIWIVSHSFFLCVCVCVCVCTHACGWMGGGACAQWFNDW
jgi:hypothetical protein